MKSFKWQWGTTTLRNQIPLVVGLTQMSVFGQRGYVVEPRKRVMSNIAAVRAFNPEVKKMGKRLALIKASETLGSRSRIVQEARRRKGHKVSLHALTMTDEDDDKAKSQRETAQIRAEIIKGTKEWKQSVAKKLHLKNDGNIITYGWILFVNLFGRQLMSLTIIKLNKGKLVAIGATALMIVYAVNVA